MTAEVIKRNLNTYYFWVAAVVALWFILIYESLFSAVAIWSTNDIYNHCFIVIPAALFLMYEKRKQINWNDARPSYMASIAFILQLLLYTLGTAADIQLFQHAAIFAMIPTLFWMFQGDRIAWQYKFPLIFMLFSIPVGEELIPILQEITADMSVAMLGWSGIPLFRSGLFIEIPQGKFLVAEACSGVSFLIASIVLGNLYAYMNLVSMKRRIAFVILSICFPIFANAIRVYGIILTGYLTDMEHAVGADHLVYGWFFFAFVLVCLFLLGELIKKFEQRAIAKKGNDAALASPQHNVGGSVAVAQGINSTLFGFVLLFLAAALIQNYRMLNIELNTELNKRQLSTIDINDAEKLDSMDLTKWQPRFVGNTSEDMFLLNKNAQNFNLYYAYYDGSEGELVSSLNKLYEQERWTLTERSRPVLADHEIVLDTVSSSNGNKRAIYYWYNVDGEIVNSFSAVKLKQLFQTLKGQQSHSVIIAVSFDVDQKSTRQKDAMSVIVEEIIETFVPIAD